MNIMEINYTHYFVKLLIASGICAGSFINNNQEGIIGSMILSPISNCILLSTINYYNSISLLIVSMAIAIVIGLTVGYFDLTNDTLKIENIENNQILSRSQKINRWTTLFVCILIGLTYSMNNYEIMGFNSYDLIGSAISISILPPLINTGILLSHKRYENAKNAFEFLMFNVSGIYIALILTEIFKSF
jgi:uncharacterized membrane protein